MSLYAVAYRTAMKLAHRFNWHHAKVLGPLQPGDGYDYQRWCQWCGFRQDFRLSTPPNQGRGQRIDAAIEGTFHSPEEKE